MISAISPLGIGPMSPEIVEAVFRYSSAHNVPLMLIASKNQIDWDRGYVMDWSTERYGAFIRQMREKYSAANVYVCRDHCGPGFKNHDLADVYKTVDADLANGFDLIHVDFCHYKGSRKDALEESAKLIHYILDQKKETLIEIGTDENTGAMLDDVQRIEEEMSFFTSQFSIHFFVCQTGTLVKEINQVGQFNETFLQRVRPLADRFGLRLKEHNADYIASEELVRRKGLIDAVNVAPQYGVLQTIFTLQRALLYGLDVTPFLREAYESRRWEKWMYVHTADNRHLCSLIAGHYVFAGPAYQSLLTSLGRYEDIRETIIEEMMGLIDLYYSALK